MFPFRIVSWEDQLFVVFVKLDKCVLFFLGLLQRYCEMHNLQLFCKQFQKPRCHPSGCRWKNLEFKFVDGACFVISIYGFSLFTLVALMLVNLNFK